jgi:ankyrin repeat protein
MIENKEKIKNAICNNETLNLKSLIKDSIDMRFEDEDNDTLLMYALSDTESKSYLYLLENGADITLVNNERENVIHSAVYSNDPERLRYLLENFKMDINSKSIEGITPLLLSLLIKSLKSFTVLINNNANINIPDNQNNYPIHIACHFGYFEIVKDLVDRGALLDVKTNKGNYPLALAINSDHENIVKYLYNKIYNKG